MLPDEQKPKTTLLLLLVMLVALLPSSLEPLASVVTRRRTKRPVAAQDERLVIHRMTFLWLHATICMDEYC